MAPSGVWKIEIENVALTETDRVQVWIRRDETLPGFPALGRQSYFDNDDYQRFDSFGAPLPIDPPGSDCLVKRRGTISGFACGEFPAVLAGYVETRNDLAGYSAAGPVTTAFNATGPTRNGPDAAAVSDDTPVLRGILSADHAAGRWCLSTEPVSRHLRLPDGWPTDLHKAKPQRRVTSVHRPHLTIIRHHRDRSIRELAAAGCNEEFVSDGQKGLIDTAVLVRMIHYLEINDRHHRQVPVSVAPRNRARRQERGTSL